LGTVDYAVWAPGTFPGTFNGFSANDYVYTYQLHESLSATETLSTFSVVLTGPTDNANIGDFSGSNNGFGPVAGEAPSEGPMRLSSSIRNRPIGHLRGLRRGRRLLGWPVPAPIRPLGHQEPPPMAS
jgi:hypothetical protein